MAASDRGVPLSTLSPKFLHSNSTSHTWPFSAIAELIDNAYDPDVSAKQFWIDKTVVKGEQCLCFMDNGNGLDNHTMHKMLSFGYSDKTAVNGLEPIGIYGNGFKSGSMRLGKDAIVFSKSMGTSCVGMLSQTYLEKIEADQIIVPIVCLETQRNNNRSVPEEYKASLQDILRYSPFNTLEELLTEIDAISQHWSSTKTGTRIIIWNLRRTSSGTTEFDFESNRYDIRIPSEVYETMNKSAQHVDSINTYTPESVFSLKAYCSILYLKPRMQIIVRGVKVKSQLIAKSLAWIRKDHYRPIFLNNNRIPIIFGYNTKSKDQYGIMMYHKNRLIKAYERVGCQLKANNKGLGVIGVIECNFLEPTHNKQNFLESDKYRKTMANLGIKLEEYWNEIRYRKSKENPNSVVPVEDTVKQPDQNWVQCDECLHWRKLPDGIDCSKLPDKWFCRMNPDPQFRRCEIDEEPEDSDDDQPYRKTYKEQEREDRRKQMADEQKRQEQQRFAELARKTEALQQRQQHLRRSLHEATIESPSTPLTPRNQSLQGGAVRAESSPQLFSNISQAACSPSSSSGLPVITNVCSLSVDTQRRKRKHPVTALASTQSQANGLTGKSCGAPTPVSVSSASSPAVPIPSDDDDDDTDDDIFILENASTPKPKQTVPDTKKPKIEKAQTEVEISMLLDCTDDDDAMDVTSDVEGAHSAAKTENGASSSGTAAPKMTTSTTQTETTKVKQEVLSQDSTEMDQTKDSTEQRGDSGSCSVPQTVIKQENQEDGHTEDRGHQMLHCGDERQEKAGPSHANTDDKTQLPAHLKSVTKSQDQLLELMQTTAKERDSLKEQVDQLNLKLVECTNVNIKKECSHKANQTDFTEEINYKNLFEKAKKKVGELIKDKEALLSACDNKTNSSATGDKPENIDDIAQQVENLLHELDQTKREKDELASQVQSLEEEKTRLVAKCEEHSILLQRLRDVDPTTSSARPHPKEEGQSSNSDRYSDTFRSLIQLRHNIGRYLVPHVPALDLEQVNFECNVIDEILEQLLSPF